MENQSSEPSRLVFDPTKFSLGRLCVNGHSWGETNQSLRAINQKNRCVVCTKNRQKRSRQKHIEARKLYEKEYRQRIINRDGHEAVKLRRREGYAANREAERLAEKMARLRNLEKYRRKEKRSYEKRIEAHRLWRRSERGLRSHRIASHRQRAFRKKAFTVRYSSADLVSVFQRFSNECVYCGNAEKLTIDHFLPLSAGGTDNLGNLVPACGACNSSKNASDPFDWYQQQPFFSKKRWQSLLKLMGKTAENYNQLPLL